MKLEMNSSDELEKFLRDWRAWDDKYAYDFLEMCVLFGACLDNLKKYALEAELEDINDILTHEQIDMLNKMSKYT